MANAERIRSYSKTQKGITVLAGIECDILADGSMDLADDCLASLDIVVASIHSALTQDEARDDRARRSRRSSIRRWTSSAT